MKARVDAGSDAAMIGAWDAARQTLPLGEDDEPTTVLESDAAAGHVFVLYTGADGGGPIDVYVDEPIPDDVVTTLREVPGRFLLAVPSGRLLVGGGEDYRSAQPSQTSDKSIVTIPPGDYEIRTLVPSDTEATPKSEAELKKRVAPEDIAYYDRTNNIGCIGGVAMFLLFPILAFPLGWAGSLAITVVAFLAYFPIRQAMLKRNERYQRLDKIIPKFRLEHDDPYLVFALRRVPERGTLRGGTAKLD